MPIKLMEDGKYKIFYKDENGQFHEFGGISEIIHLDNEATTTCDVPRYLNNDIYFSFDVKWTNKKLRKAMKHWLNCLSRRNRRAKRIKEQARRAILKWRTLQHDGE